MNNRRLWFAQRSGHALGWIARRPHFRSPRSDSNADVADIRCCCLAVQCVGYLGSNALIIKGTRPELTRFVFSSLGPAGVALT